MRSPPCGDCNTNRTRRQGHETDQDLQEVEHLEADGGGGHRRGRALRGILPETDPGAMDEPEWAADSVQELIDFIDSYEK